MKYSILICHSFFLLLAFLCQCEVAFSRQTDQPDLPITIFGQIRTVEPSTEVNLEFWENPMNVQNGAPAPLTELIKLTDGTLHQGTYGSTVFNWTSDSISQPGRLTLSLGYKMLINDFLVFPGDSIQLYFDEYSGQLVFGGPAQSHFNLQNELQNLQNRLFFNSPVNIHTYRLESMLRNGNSYEDFQNIQKNNFGRKVNIEIIDPPLMLEELIGKIKSMKELDPMLSLLNENNEINPQVKNAIRNKLVDGRLTLYAKSLGTILRYSTKLQDSTTYSSALEFIENEFIPDLTSKGNEMESGDFHPYLTSISELLKITEGAYPSRNTVGHITSNFKDELRDQLLASTIFLEYRRGISTDNRLRDIASSINQGPAKEEVNRLLEKTKTGVPVRHFEFTGESGENISLDQLKGQYLFIYTYFDGCNASSSYYNKSIKPVAEYFSDSKDLRIVSVSADRTKNIWHSSLESKNYSDTNILNLYSKDKGVQHPFFSYYNLIGFPSQMLIDPQGNIAAVSGFNHTAEEIIRRLEDFMAPKDNPDHIIH